MNQRETINRTDLSVADLNDEMLETEELSPEEWAERDRAAAMGDAQDVGVHLWAGMLRWDSRRELFRYLHESTELPDNYDVIAAGEWEHVAWDSFAA